MLKKILIFLSAAVIITWGALYYISTEKLAITFGQDVTEVQTEEPEMEEVINPTPQPDTNPEQQTEHNYLERTVTTDTYGRQTVNNPEDILVLVNKERSLPGDYVPADLVKPDIPFPFSEELPKKMLRKDAAAALEQLFSKAAEAGIELYGQSGYRSYKRQKEIFDYKAGVRGEEAANRTSARPGQSEHQTGLAMDVTNSEVNFKLEQSFGETEAGKWLVKHAADFGFIIRYPKGKENITGYSYEPWHLRYVGTETAQAVMDAQLTLEEYLRDHY